jgi:hypothetical protein
MTWTPPDVERWWFRMHGAQEDVAFPYDPDAVGLDFDDIEDADAAANLAAFSEECAGCNRANQGQGAR